jgi:hypothetical protein
MQKLDLVVDVELKLVMILFKKPLVEIRDEQSAEQRHHEPLQLDPFSPNPSFQRNDRTSEAVL